MLLVLLALACHPDDPAVDAISVSPAELSLFGYEAVQIDLSQTELDPAEILSASVGGIAAYDLAPDGEVLTLTVQGAPEAGPAALILEDSAGEHRYEDALFYTAPLDPAFERLVVVGASLGMGVQSGVPNNHGQLHSPAAVLARQLGAYNPPPLLVDDLFRGIEAQDVGAPPDCAVPDVTALAASSASESLALMRDPESGEFGYQWGRVDPDIEVHNLSVGGSGVCDVVNGPGDFGETFLSHLTYEPYAGLGDEVSNSQLDLARAMAPSLLVSFDMTGNDLIDMVLGETLDPSLATPEEEYSACLAEFLTAAADADEVFLANAPDVNALPYAGQLAARLVADGTMSAEQVAALQAEVRATVQRYNSILEEQAAAYPNVHIVDVFSRVDTLRAEGLDAGDEHLEIGLLDGLISLDGVHFSDTGYAMLADLFVGAINGELGTAAPAVDLEAVLAQDPYSPDALRAEGLDPEACE